MKYVIAIVLSLAAFNVQAQESPLKLACETTTKYVVQAYLLGVERGVPVEESFNTFLEKDDVKRNLMVYNMIQHYFPIVFNGSLNITRNSVEIMNNIAVPVLQACYSDLPQWEKRFSRTLVLK